MKRAMFSVLTVLVLASLVGCARHRCCGPYPGGCGDGRCAEQGCQSCDDPGKCDGDGCCQKHCCKGWRLFGNHCCCRPAAPPQEAASPAGGALTYPYYTVRGPRDYLAKNPPSIGP